jgi:hypothetical protein
MEFLDRVYDFAANFLSEEVHRSAPSHPHMGLPSACTVQGAAAIWNRMRSKMLNVWWPFSSNQVRPGAVDKAAGSAKSAAKNLLGGSASAIKAVTMLALESPALIQTPAFR